MEKPLDEMVKSYQSNALGTIRGMSENLLYERPPGSE